MRKFLYELALVCLYCAIVRCAGLVADGLATHLDTTLGEFSALTNTGLISALAYGCVYWVNQRYKRHDKP